jgi:dihydrodipicolinate synthase/N-acetylneuraminate lyase
MSFDAHRMKKRESLEIRVPDHGINLGSQSDWETSDSLRVFPVRVLQAMSSRIFHGIVPPLASPLNADGSVDIEGLKQLACFQMQAGVHGLWVLGTTARFEMIPDSEQRPMAEAVLEVAGEKLPLVVNVSDGSTRRTLERARQFDDLPYQAYAVLPPWYQPLVPARVVDYFRSLADRLSRPIVIYNAPWVCNQLSFAHLRQLAEHERIIGCKDVTDDLTRPLEWTVAEREAQGFSYLMGTDLIAEATALGADGFVTSLTNAVPELVVEIWNAARAGDSGRAFAGQCKMMRVMRAVESAPNLSGLEAVCRHRGLLRRMLPEPLGSLEPEQAERVVGLFDAAMA